MPSKNKRRHLRKKYHRIRKDNRDDGNDEGKLDLLEKQIDGANRDGNGQPFCQKRQLLDIIQKITCQLQLDTDNQFLSLLEKILTIVDGRSEKKSLLLQLLSMFFTNILDCEEDEIYKLKVVLSSKILPRELKNLVVGDDALVETSYSPMGIFGHFGVLKEGVLTTPRRRRVPVIIKESLAIDCNQYILSEAKILAQLDHDNIIKILAFQKKGTTLRFATEYMELNDLEEALQEYNFTNRKLLLILKDVAEGMRYVAEKKYVHRNLICRNVLLDSRGTCKIGGFDLCRYVGDTGGVCEDEEMDLENFYIAPETKKTHRFTTKTDMWAMGLLSWEVLYIARDSLRQNQSFAREVMKLKWLAIFALRGILPNPGRCSPVLWMYIREMLLNTDPDKRPSFAELRKQLDRYDNLFF